MRTPRGIRPPDRTALAALALAIAACGGAAPAAATDAKITGTAFYRERVALAPDALFEAELISEFATTAESCPGTTASQR